MLGLALAAIAGLAFVITRCPGDQTPEPIADLGEPDAGRRQPSTELLAPDEFEIPEAPPDTGPPPDAGRQEIVRRPRPQGSSDFMDCAGDISGADARRVTHEYNTAIRNCYERRLKQDQTLQGNINIAIRVASNGSVDGVQITGTLRDREVFSCVRQVVAQMRFPAPGGRDCAIISVPYSFTPQN